MKPLKAALLGLGIGFAFEANPAAAWMQWYRQDVPFGPAPGFWLYQNIPQGPTLGLPLLWFYQTPALVQGQPLFWQYQSFPQGLTTMWSSTIPTSGLYVEQFQSPVGYSVRVYTGHPTAEDVGITVEGGALVIRRIPSTETHSRGPMQAFHSSWSTQFVALPADANIAAMRMQRGNGMVGIFIPRAR
jgi:hypothetical protein